MGKLKEGMAGSLSGMTDDLLFSTWEVTNSNDDENMPAVREFLMKEIEKRYPEDFANWMLSDDVEKMNHPRLFINQGE